MEKIKKFLEISSGYGDGSGYGYGYGSGSGYGSGYGDGYGSGSGSGSGYGSGYGYGYGSGSGYGSGYGDGYGDGCGYGDGYGDGISSFNGQIVHLVDGIQTIIKSVVQNLAKGFILNDDLTLSPCYIAKSNNLFAHGETAQKASEALQEKIFANLDTDTAIQMFMETFKEDKKYPAKDFWVWHNRLTGSCEMGRNQFVTQHGFDMENDTFTVSEFIKITKDAFGGDIIKRLAEALKEGE